MTKPVRLFVVEDELGIRTALTTQLRQIFDKPIIVERRTVNDASRYLDEISDESTDDEIPDLAVVDLRLPLDGQINIDGGFKVIEKLNGLQRAGTKANVPTIAISVRSDAQATERAEELGVRKFFEKPWGKKELEAVARESVRSGSVK